MRVHFNFNRLLCTHSLVSPFHPQVTGLAQIHNELCSVMQDPLYTQRKTQEYTHTHTLHTGAVTFAPAGAALSCTHGLFGAQTPAHFWLCSVTRAFRSYDNNLQQTPLISTSLLPPGNAQKGALYTTRFPLNLKTWTDEQHGSEGWSQSFSSLHSLH